MKIPCFRCGKKIDAPCSSNADYVIASDMIAKEDREVLTALKHNVDTWKKKKEGEAIADEEYDAVELPRIEDSETIGPDLVKVVAKKKVVDVQKTGIVCPDCYKPSDVIIWGVHKEAP